MTESTPIGTGRSPLPDRIDRARLLDDLRRLVSEPSMTGNEAAVAAWCAASLREMGLMVEIHRPDPATIRTDPDWPGQEADRTELPVVIASAGPDGGRRIILSGHLDVVPPGDPSSWSTDPWGAEVRGDLLYGRGACDMKGGVAAILAAVRALAAGGSLSRLEGRLLVVLVPSEEDGGQGTLAAIRAGASADAAIITEPSGLDVVVAHAGAITFRLVVPGRAAHASRRREGVSALDNLQLIMRALEADEERRNAAESHPLMAAIGLPYPTIVGIVQGGEWASTVLDRVTADGRYGVRLGQSTADAEAELRAAVEAACAQDPFLREHPATIEISGGRFGSASVATGDPLPVGLANAVEAVVGRRPEVLGVPYGADMHMFINAGQTPCVIFGPGDVRAAHSADEHVSISEVETCAQVLAAWVRDQIGGSTGRSL